MPSLQEGFRLVLLPALLLTSIPALAQPSEIEAVETDGAAVLRICRDSVFSADCRIYGHIVLPRRIKQGDVFSISFGSNPKRIRFETQSIQMRGEGCDILGTAGDQNADRLTSKRCRVLETADLIPPPQPRR